MGVGITLASLVTEAARHISAWDQEEHDLKTQEKHIPPCYGVHGLEFALIVPKLTKNVHNFITCFSFQIATPMCNLFHFHFIVFFFYFLVFICNLSVCREINKHKIKEHCHAIVTTLSRYCTITVTLLYYHSHAIVSSPSRYYDITVTLLYHHCYAIILYHHCHAIASTLSCYCSITVTLMYHHCHAIASSLSCYCSITVTLLHHHCHTIVASLLRYCIITVTLLKRHFKKL